MGAPLSSRPSEARAGTHNHKYALETTLELQHGFSNEDSWLWVPAFAGTTVGPGRQLDHALQQRVFRRLHRVGGSDMHPDAVEPQSKQTLLLVGAVENFRQ